VIVGDQDQVESPVQIRTALKKSIEVAMQPDDRLVILGSHVDQCGAAGEFQQRSVRLTHGEEVRPHDGLRRESGRGGQQQCGYPAGCLGTSQFEHNRLLELL
jgi:hypothetical protein